MCTALERRARPLIPHHCLHQTPLMEALIEEERKEILAEAAGKLGLAYMPRGVLSSFTV